MIDSLFSLFAATCTKSNFLGLVPWYQYLDYGSISVGKKESYCGVRSFNILPNNEPSDIPLVLLAVVDNILRIAGLIAVIFVIYGAVQYLSSQGSPDQAAKAQSTIINALAGLAICLVAITFVAFLGSRLG